MKLILTNSIDNKIFTTYNTKTIKMLDSENVDFFGINISSDQKSDYKLKIYYQDMYSRYLYANNKNKNLLIDFLIKNNILLFLTLLQNESENFIKYDAQIAKRTNDIMENLFEYMDKNIKIFQNNKDDILKISKMKYLSKNNCDYSSLTFLSYMNDSILKCHWMNKIINNHELYNNKYYLDFIDQLQISNFKILSNIIKKFLLISEGSLWMEGIDFDNKGANKHKIYIRNSKKIYEGLLKAISNSELQNKIIKVKEWHKYHKEFCCVGFALCLDRNNVYSLNFYYKNEKVYKIY